MDLFVIRNSYFARDNMKLEWDIDLTILTSIDNIMKFSYLCTYSMKYMETHFSIDWSSSRTAAFTIFQY